MMLISIFCAFADLIIQLTSTAPVFMFPGTPDTS
jgi:hypothetical protein